MWSRGNVQGPAIGIRAIIRGAGPTDHELNFPYHDQVWGPSWFNLGSLSSELLVPIRFDLVLCFDVHVA